MAENTGIEWTDATWNPTIGCSVVSPGCTNCYAMKMAGRLEAMGQPAYQGHTIKTKAGFVWNGKVAASNHGQMIKPLRWKKPRRVFVNSMSDLFHEDMPEEIIDQVFAVMALCPQHTFQVLTKRAERMRDYIGTRAGDWQIMLPDAFPAGTLPLTKNDVERHLGRAKKFSYDPPTPQWPLENVWLGVSVEDRRRADERLSHLRNTPAAVRFISAEPLLEDPGEIDLTGISWVIVGGESGPNARPYRYEWAQRIIDQCAAAGLAAFHKQVGAHPIGFDGRRVHLKDRKGGDPELWPAGLRVRQMPQPAGGVG